MRDIFFVTARYLLYAFLLLSSSTPSPFLNDALVQLQLDTYIAMGGILRDGIMSKRSKIWKSIIQYYSLFLYATLFFSSLLVLLSFLMN